MVGHASLAAEFPNDNPSLHCGVIWVCLDPIGAPTADRSAVVDPPIDARSEVEVVAAVEVAAEVMAVAEVVEVVEAAASEPEPALSAVEVAVACEPVTAFDLEEVTAALDAAVSGSGYAIGEATDEGIVVEELEPIDETAVFEEFASNTELPPGPDDPYTMLVCTLADVAIGAGSPHVAAALPGLLLDGRIDDATDEIITALREAGIVEEHAVTAAFGDVTRAWRAILRGTSDDFGACGGAMLDEWAAGILARLLGGPSREPLLRRELRARGVAAFGLVEAM